MADPNDKNELRAALTVALSLLSEKREELDFCAVDGDSEEDRKAAETEAEELADAYDCLHALLRSLIR